MNEIYSKVILFQIEYTYTHENPYNDIFWSCAHPCTHTQTHTHTSNSIEKEGNKELGNEVVMNRQVET